MNILKSIILSFAFLLFSWGIVSAQEVSLDIVESANGCDLATDCAADFICFDIRMTIDIDKNLDSYNIWVLFDNDVLSRINGGDDSSCVVDDGGDTDIEETAGAYRVAGIPGSPFPMTAGNQEIVHTICFSIMDIDAVDGSTLSVGGNLYGALPTSITFSDGATDAVDEITPLILSHATVSCFILPVELLYFEAKKLESRESFLEWVTLSEVNNDYFEIQRSSDGKVFSTIGMVDGMGSTSQESKYTFSDHNPNRSNYYRLKQVDFDGVYEYSDIRFVSFDSDKDLAIYAFPNPFTDKIALNVSSGIYNISIYDIYGKLKLNKSYMADEKLDLQTLNSGTYIIKVENEIGSEIHNQIIIKG